MCISDWSWYFDWSRPIIVEEAQLKWEGLNLQQYTRFSWEIIMQYFVVGGSDSSLSSFLWDEIEVIALCDPGVHNTPRLWIVTVAGIKLGTNSFIGENEHQFDWLACCLDGLLKLCHFDAFDYFFLSITCSIPKDYNIDWQYAIVA